MINRRLLLLLLFGMSLVCNSWAEVMVPIQSKQKVKHPRAENRRGGTISKVDPKGIEINGTYYPLIRYGVKIHSMNGQFANPSTLKKGVLVSVELKRQDQKNKISEIWVIKDE